uniref:IgGFc-binding protein N-terminal domain-containing protein n=1 Tax=Plectus sambesii TaxID=2011161 RepID=A0A914X2J2_9BILA
MMAGHALCWLLVSAVFAYVNSKISTTANDFVFTFINAYEDANIPGVLLLALVSNNNNGTANVVVTSPYPLFTTIKVSVAPYSVLKIPITPESIEDQYPGDNYTWLDHIIVEDKGVRLQSDLPVAVYAHAEFYSGVSADSFLVIPAVHLGMQYVAVTSTNKAPLSRNMIAVVAYQDNTQVTIGTQTVTINALQVASIASTAFLSGTVLSGNKPFGAISGCTDANDGHFQSGDYEAVMLLPVGVWGTQFTAIPFMYFSTNSYQVVSNTDNTVVSARDKIIATLNVGEYRNFSIGAALVTSNYPVQLIQIGEDTGGQDDLGGAFFLQLPSTDKMSNTSVLFQPTGFFEYYYAPLPLQFIIRIVTNLAGAGTIKLDGTTISALQFKHVPYSNFYYYESRTLNTTHSVTTNNPETKYSVSLSVLN